MKIRVTKKHIEEGHGGDAWRCPVALAIREQTGCRYVQVGRTGINIIPKRCRAGRTVKLSRIATDFIVAFDRDKKVSGFTFDLAVPS